MTEFEQLALNLFVSSKMPDIDHIQINLFSIF